MNTYSKLFSFFLFMCISTVFAKKNAEYKDLKDPVFIEVYTRYESIEDALREIKTLLLNEKFITENGIVDSGFTAKMTTGSKADYYIADVTAVAESGKIKVNITFIKVGTGLKSMKKLAEKIEEKIIQL